MNLLKNIVFVWIQYRHFQAAYAELRRSDRELSDLGLTRGDIGSVAFAEAERRMEAAVATPEWPIRDGRRADAVVWRADQEITRWVPSVTPVAANITSPRARSCRS